MLTAGALHGVNHALNHVMSLTMSKESTVTFGAKSILAVGDLFQLPAVERFRFKEQVLHPVPKATPLANQTTIDHPNLSTHAWQ